MAMFYAANASASSSDAVTCQWSSADYTLAVMTLVYAGADPTAPLDATASGNVQGGTTLQTSVFSTTSANEVIVAGMMSGSGCNPPPTPGSSYTIELNAVPSDCAGPIAAAEDVLRRQRFQPLVVILMQTALVVVNEHAGGDVHGVDEY